jgi:hypothetical protein
VLSLFSGADEVLIHWLKRSDLPGSAINAHLPAARNANTHAQPANEAGNAGVHSAVGISMGYLDPLQILSAHHADHAGSTEWIASSWSGPGM